MQDPEEDLASGHELVKVPLECVPAARAHTHLNRHRDRLAREVFMHLHRSLAYVSLLPS